MTEVIVTAAKVAYAIMVLLLFYLIVKLTIRMLRAAFLGRGGTMIESREVTLLGRRIRIDVDLFVMTALYATLSVWNVLGLPTGL